MDFLGCSISYAVARLAEFNYFLYKFNGDNAVFVDSSIMQKIKIAEKVDFPVDEFFCYYQAPIHIAYPGLDYIREWISDSRKDVRDVYRRIYKNVTRAHRLLGLRDGEMPFTLDV